MTARNPNINFPVGTFVRSYDFPHLDTYYCEGTVIETNGMFYKIKVERLVVNGQEENLNGYSPEVTVAKNGTEGMFGPTNGVVKAEKPSDVQVA